MQVESCHELVESSSGAGAGHNSGPAAALRAHLSRCELHDGHAYLHADEVNIFKKTKNLRIIYFYNNLYIISSQY